MSTFRKKLVFSDHFFLIPYGYSFLVLKPHRPIYFFATMRTYPYGQVIVALRHAHHAIAIYNI